MTPGRYDAGRLPALHRAGWQAEESGSLSSAPKGLNDMLGCVHVRSVRTFRTPDASEIFPQTPCGISAQYKAMEPKVNERLREMRERAGFTVRGMADALGKPGSTYASYERDSYKQPVIPVQLARAMAPLLVDRGEPRITVEEVMSLAGVTGEIAAAAAKKVIPQTNGRGIQVPELDARPQAGNGAADIDEAAGHQVVAHWTMPASYLRAFVDEPSKIVILRVAGDSMEPDYPAGERVAVDTSHKVPSPPGVYVLWDGFGLVLKRVEIIPGSSPRKVRLMSINPGYPTYEVPLDYVQINGRVVGKWTWK